MAEELLDVADVGATGQEMRDAGVPQTMHGRAAFLIKSRREAAGPVSLIAITEGVAPVS